MKFAHIADTHIKNLKYHQEYKIVFQKLYQKLREEKVDYIMTNFDELNERINLEIRKKFVEGYDYDKLCMHWYNIFKNLDKVTNG